MYWQRREDLLTEAYIARNRGETWTQGGEIERTRAGNRRGFKPKTRALPRSGTEMAQERSETAPENRGDERRAQAGTGGHRAMAPPELCTADADADASTAAGVSANRL
jgi:hypothetical protein